MRELKSHRIEREILELYVELRKHQDKCKHTKVIRKYGSNSGNYDPSCDSYWIDFDCPTCLKQWMEDQ
jgi:choline kinase